MNQEDFVTLKTAVLLKLNGFNWPCEHRYRKAMAEIKSGEVGDEYVYFPKPTLYVAQKWLREQKGVHITVDYNFPTDKWFYMLIDIKKGRCMQFSDNEYFSFEEAVQAGILEAIKMI